MTDNPETNQIQTLKTIYHLYDRQMEKITAACRKHCSACCTTNVTMTRLEGLLICASVSREIIAAALPDPSNGLLPRFRPSLSTNGYAKLCGKEDGPHDDDDSREQPGSCPFLKDSVCTIYPARPFGCRCMMSTTMCNENGYAVIDDFTLTVNTLFLQFIEHYDQGGFFGNMTDVLAYLIDKDENPRISSRIIANQPIPALMVPPGHRENTTALVNALHKIITAV